MASSDRRPSGAYPHRILRRTDLLAAGFSTHGITRAVRDGVLLRPRQGHYLPADAQEIVVDAVRCGGRVDCVTLLAAAGVFVLDRPRLHVQLDPHASRVPDPGAGAVRHWRSTRADGDAALVSIVEALAQAVRCQQPRAAIATLDSAWHLGVVDENGIAETFGLIPARYDVLLPLLDRRCESGPETLVRLILRTLGCFVELQVFIDEVGRVDFLVDGWLIVECDSVAHHSGWNAQVIDRRRDLAAAALGYSTVRLLADDVFRRPDWVRELLRRALSHRSRTPEKRSGKRRARPTRA